MLAFFKSSLPEDNEGLWPVSHRATRLARSGDRPEQLRKSYFCKVQLARRQR